MTSARLLSADGPERLSAVPSSRPNRVPLGQILVSRGALSPVDRRFALERMARFDTKLGDILLAQKLVDRPRLFDALAEQFGCEVADFDAVPPDLDLFEKVGAEQCLKLGVLPWVERDGRTLVASGRPEDFDRHLPLLESLLGPVSMAVTGEIELHRAVQKLQPQSLIRRAETRVPELESCRSMAFSFNRLPPLALVLFLVLAVAVIFHPLQSARAFTVWAIVTLLANSTLKLAAMLRQLRAPAEPDQRTKRPIVARLPRVSLLVPLYKERKIAARLIGRLERLDYPRELLDILLIVEADDTTTRAALAEIDLPQHMRPVVVPASRLKTKPRALNYALEFARGSLIGVYDAEDAPAPDQILRVVERFHERGPDLACVQAVLDFYNSRSNWLARCFAVEYAAWFRVVLPGMTRLGLVAPLGGTSLFFRRTALENLGGWDAHNVTEDADLGVRLARHGYRTEFIESVTAEEANCRAWPWIRQRSRWLKGYMMTWAVHMRRPWRLWRELGAWRFLGVQLLFLGTISQFLLAPFLWLFWLMPFGIQHPFAPLIGTAGTVALVATFIASEAISLAVGLFAVRGRQHRHLLPWVITLHFYFPLAALAAYKGLFDLLTRPFFWDKTAHGLYDETAEATTDSEQVRPRRFRQRRA
ncbi:glycosyltransferase [Pseudoruegeria sp. HB172150]|uniref:glycosyltransferase n=1 Tax=Pseudoruegeria sp. HB172150 TaxID=2721164 RepID=UPI0015544B2F|nr:glycosyltransferase [Pseudoruegeria sp. HB172150]